MLKKIIEAKDMFKTSLVGKNLYEFDLIKGYIYSNIGKQFCVSDSVIEKRIASENIDVKGIFEME